LCAKECELAASVDETGAGKGYYHVRWKIISDMTTDVNRSWRSRSG